MRLSGRSATPAALSAYGPIVAPRRAPFPLRMAASMRRASLDRLLAQGGPVTGPLLALRSSELRDAQARARLATAFRDVVRSVDGTRRVRRRSPRAAVNAVAVRACATEIEDLARALTDIDPDVRGVAIARRLLMDGLGPLYDPGEPHMLRCALRSTRSAL